MFHGKKSFINESEIHPDRAEAASHDRPERIGTFEELRRIVLKAVRDQNPDWVQPDGSSPTFDSYERRFGELLEFFGRCEKRQAPYAEGDALFCS